MQTKRKNLKHTGVAMKLTSKTVTCCQSCENPNLQSILFLGYIPPPSRSNKSSTQLTEEINYPLELLYCTECYLVQLGLVVNKEILFPSEFPYTSSTTKILRDNFSDLYDECEDLLNIPHGTLVVDIGSNDGNLLNNFKNTHNVLGVTPETIGNIAIDNGIPTIIDYFTESVVSQIKINHGKARLITATNVFAHIDNINDIIRLILELMDDDGVFVIEIHYLLPLIETLQYDTIYLEHMRYYSLYSLNYSLRSNGLEIFYVKEIPTHGGSIRVYSSRKGNYKIDESVNDQFEKENKVIGFENLTNFRKDVVNSKLNLYKILSSLKDGGSTICCIGAPARGSTLVNYVGLDEGIIDYACEVKGSQKIGNNLPGTIIPIVEESVLFTKQPDYALLLSWHISDELIPKLRSQGYKGKFIVPLPHPRIISA